MSNLLNISVGLLGHIDCGKTSLAKVLSTTNSTACFDKNPQSQERGITIDLGFSSFNMLPPDSKNFSNYKMIQITLVDCPGHASLIKTIIGGSQIINIALLVIDITKGMETQTAECLVISEITCDKLIVVLNKIDLLDDKLKDNVVTKVTKKMKLTLSNTKFKNANIVSVSANPANPIGIEELKQELLQTIEPPVQFDNTESMIMAVDHCFSIKGQGTVFTGNMLQGSVAVNDIIEIPQLKINKKVKSIQIFHKNVSKAIKGDRLGLCVTQFDSKLFERGLITSENYLKYIFACIIDLNLIKYFKHEIKSKGKYHCSIGYETVLAKITIFKNEEDDNQTNISTNKKEEETNENIEQPNNSNPNQIKQNEFNIKNNYLYIDTISNANNSEQNNKNNSNNINNNNCYALLEFDKPILAIPNSLLIGSKLDTNIYSKTCRLAFYGYIKHIFVNENYELSNALNIYKNKIKIGNIDKIINNNEIICKNLFNKKQLNYIDETFLNFNIELSNGQTGRIENMFGKNGKIKIRLNENDNVRNENDVKKGGGDDVILDKNCDVILKFKKYLFHKKKLSQH